ncbi:MAG: arginine--tRNA ligase [Defluviitaleaceae bacterium]|nr:arginine--tRNA ligase [Defluviitaleaceae bacterium]
MNYKNEIAKLLGNIIEMPIDEIELSVETPANAAMGDFAFPCHKLSKAMRKAPNMIAAEFADKIGVSVNCFERIEAAGPYLNFFVNKSAYVANVINEICEKRDNYGTRDVGIGKTVCIDYSSPNVTHEFHIGHLYSTVIGAALYRMYKFLGYNTVGINYIGDWGSQFGKLVYAFTEWSSLEQVELGGLDELTRVYVKYHVEEEKNPELKQSARSWLVRMEQGDETALAHWRMICDICLASMDKTYKRLGISFDSYRGESYYNDKMTAVVNELQDKKLLTESDGAQIVDLTEHKMPVCLILRGDGGTLYPTRDIAAAFDRKEMYGFHKSLYVTDSRQSLHFAQWFKVVELMGYNWVQDMVHIPYGLMSLESGALSARKGNVIHLEDFFNEAARRIMAIINEKNASLPNKDAVAEAVGVGAVVFDALNKTCIKDKVFSWESALNFDGETGPYVQYTHARAASVLEKAADAPDVAGIDFSALTDEAAFTLIKSLASFPDKIREAAEKYEPFILSRALIGIAQNFNKFYHDNPILTSEAHVRNARLCMVRCVKDVLKTGLALLGLKAPEKM